MRRVLLREVRSATAKGWPAFPRDLPGPRPRHHEPLAPPPPDEPPPPSLPPLSMESLLEEPESEPDDPLEMLQSHPGDDPLRDAAPPNGRRRYPHTPPAIATGTSRNAVRARKKIGRPANMTMAHMPNTRSEPARTPIAWPNVAPAITTPASHIAAMAANTIQRNTSG